VGNDTLMPNKSVLSSDAATSYCSAAMQYFAAVKRQRISPHAIDCCQYCFTTVHHCLTMIVMRSKIDEPTVIGQDGDRVIIVKEARGEGRTDETVECSPKTSLFHQFCSKRHNDVFITTGT
jgi:hypothetical protein